MDPEIFRLDPDTRIRIPELKYISGSGRPINYGTGRIRVLPTWTCFCLFDLKVLTGMYSKDADSDS